MRPEKQARVILSQLEVLEDLKSQVERVSSYITHVVQKGTSWLEETDNNNTFIEITQLLAKETSKCVSKCLALPNQGEGVVSHPQIDTDEPPLEVRYVGSSSVPSFKDSMEYQGLIEKVGLLETSIAKITDKFRNYKKQTNDILVRQKKETEKEMQSKYDEIIKDNFATRNFVSQIQTEKDTLLNQWNENKQELNQMKKTITDREEKNEIIIGQQITLENNFSLKFNEVMKEILRINESSNKLKSHCENLTTKIFATDKKFSLMRNSFDKVSISEQKMKDLGEKINLIEKSLRETNEREVSNISLLEKNHEKIQAKENNISVLQLQVRSLSSILEDIKTKCESSVSHASSLKKDIVDLTAKLSTLRKSTDQAIQRQEKRTNALVKTFTDLDTKFQSVRFSKQFDKQFEENAGHMAGVAGCQVCNSRLSVALKSNEVLTCFNEIKQGSKQGSRNTFNPKTGTFTAPSEGTYLYYLKVDIYYNQEKHAIFEIRQRKMKEGKEKVLTSLYVRKSYAPGLAMGICKMSSNDQIYIKTLWVPTQFYISSHSEFMCIRLNNA